MFREPHVIGLVLLIALSITLFFLGHALLGLAVAVLSLGEFALLFARVRPQFARRGRERLRSARGGVNRRQVVFLLVVVTLTVAGFVLNHLT